MDYPQGFFPRLLWRAGVEITAHHDLEYADVVAKGFVDPAPLPAADISAVPEPAAPDEGKA
jgi:hypothetical protein